MPSWGRWPQTLEPGYSCWHFSLYVFWQIIIMPTQTIEGSRWWLFCDQSKPSAAAVVQEVVDAALCTYGAGSKAGKRGLHLLLLCSLLLRAVWTCKSCCGAVVVYQVKACGMVMDAKVLPRSSYGPICSWNIRGQWRTVPSEATRVKYKWKDANLIVQTSLLFIQQMLFDPRGRIIL